MSRFKFSKRSLAALDGVHPALVAVITMTLQKSPIDFTVVEGLRTLQRQKYYVAKGVSKTMNSRHLTGHAVDIYPYVGGTLVVDNGAKTYLKAITDVAKSVSAELGIPIVCGIDWGWDAFHIELDRKHYP